MAYGEHRRAQAGRNFGPATVFGLGVTAAFGIGAAVIVDLIQQREASALYVMNRWVLELTTRLGLETVPLYGVMLILMVIGGFSVAFFQPVTFRGAFTQGFGVLAALVTMSPSDLGAPLDAPGEQPNLNVSQAGPGMVPTGLEAQMVPVSLVQNGSEKYQLRIQVEFPDGLKEDWQSMIRRNRLGGKLWNPETGVRYNLFRNSGAEITYDDNVLRIRTDVAGIDESAELWLLIEADGYRIEEDAFTARAGANPIWAVEMEPTNQPLLLQRLRHSYRF